VHRYEVPMTIDVHALEIDGTRTHARFESTRAFVREDDDGVTASTIPYESETASTIANDAAAADDALRSSRTRDQDTDVLLDEPLFRVRAAIVDHEMPVLAFAIEEKAQVRVAADRIAAMGVTTGPWLRTLKQAVLAGAPDDTAIAVEWNDRRGSHAERRTVGELRALVLDTVPGRRIGYVTDLRDTTHNVEQLARLLGDVDLLYIEAVFLDADRAQAARKNHLTARQAGTIARVLRAKKVAPFHHSPRYRGSEAELHAEVEAAWRGT